MKNLIYLATLAFMVACQPATQKEATEQEAPAYQKPDHHSESLTKVFDAHGGYEPWSAMKSLSYMKEDESTITNLQNRKIRLESPKQTIGFDGTDVWVTPDSVDTERTRFYHNLYFYFYAMPFVVGDPGAYYEDVEARELNGKTYNGIKVSYGVGVGDAPDDNYIIWYDQETYKMEWLMYTVTFRTGEATDNYKLIRYENWDTFNGLLLPTSIQWYNYDGEAVGEARDDATVFENIQLSTEAPDESLFEKPEGAFIAPLNNAAVE
ncbi:DUF6503 family protein [Ekhidna sp. To15]|uniref:DUF6503 family protein n=1 Tax=Ekhidna sp. To15 TaxID=3395267 RepID=UPI003F51C03C